MKVVVDTNIVFSALMNAENSMGDVLPINTETQRDRLVQFRNSVFLSVNSSLSGKVEQKSLKRVSVSPSIFFYSLASPIFRMAHLSSEFFSFGSSSFSIMRLR